MEGLLLSSLGRTLLSTHGGCVAFWLLHLDGVTDTEQATVSYFFLRLGRLESLGACCQRPFASAEDFLLYSNTAEIVTQQNSKHVGSGPFLFFLFKTGSGSSSGWP